MNAEPDIYVDKIFYTIGEVSEITGLKNHILRYWESEFPALRPQKGPNGRRVYRRDDIRTVLLIKRLLYNEGYTVAGARKKLGASGRRAAQARRDALAAVREELQKLLSLLGP